MPNNKSKQSIIEGFFDRVFASVAKKAQDKAIQNLAKKDPQFAKDYKALQKIRDKIEKDMKKKAKDSKKKESDFQALKRMRAKVAREGVNEVETVSQTKSKKKIKYKDEEGNTKEVSLSTALKNKKHPAHKRAITMIKQIRANTKKQKAAQEKERDKERARQDKATKDSLKDLGKDVDPITQFFTRPK